MAITSDNMSPKVIELTASMAKDRTKRVNKTQNINLSKRPGHSMYPGLFKQRPTKKISGYWNFGLQDVTYSFLLA